jgi:hypothetical protein
MMSPRLIAQLIENNQTNAELANVCGVRLIDIVRLRAGVGYVTHDARMKVRAVVGQELRVLQPPT